MMLHTWPWQSPFDGTGMHNCNCYNTFNCFSKQIGGPNYTVKTQISVLGLYMGCFEFQGFVYLHNCSEF